MLQKMKSLCFTTVQGNYTFLAANWNKSVLKKTTPF